MLVAVVVLTRPRRCGKTQPFASVNTARLPLTQEPEIALSPRLESCCIRRSPECWFSHESRPSYDCPDQICKHSEREKKKGIKWASVLRKQFLILLTVGLWWMSFADDFQPVYIWVSQKVTFFLIYLFIFFSLAVCQGITNCLSLLGTKEDHYLNMVKTYSNCTVVLENLEITYMEEHRDLSFLRVRERVVSVDSLHWRMIQLCLRRSGWRLARKSQLLTRLWTLGRCQEGPHTHSCWS